MSKRKALESEYDWGTVPYHQQQAAWWRRSKRRWVFLGAMGLSASMGNALIWTDATPAFFRVVITGIWVGVLWSSGGGYSYTKQKAFEHRKLAWQAETSATMLGMASSGEFSLEEAMAAMRDGPVPPGMSQQEWVEMHDEALADLRRKGAL